MTLRTPPLLDNLQVHLPTKSDSMNQDEINKAETQEKIKKVMRRIGSSGYWAREQNPGHSFETTDCADSGCTHKLIKTTLVQSPKSKGFKPSSRSPLYKEYQMCERIVQDMRAKFESIDYIGWGEAFKICNEIIKKDHISFVDKIDLSRLAIYKSLVITEISIVIKALSRLILMDLDILHYEDALDCLLHQHTSLNYLRRLDPKEYLQNKKNFSSSLDHVIAEVFSDADVQKSVLDFFEDSEKFSSLLQLIEKRKKELETLTDK